MSEQVDRTQKARRRCVVKGFAEGEVAITVYPPARELAAWLASWHPDAQMNALGTVLLIRRREDVMERLFRLAYDLVDARAAICHDIVRRFGGGAADSLSRSIHTSGLALT